MVTWIFGQTGSGKTTLSNNIRFSIYQAVEEKNPYNNAIILDGDKMREIWKDLGLSKEGRWEQNLRVAKLAKLFDDQGHNVIVSVICPYKELRKKVKDICNCKFIYIEGGDDGKNKPFEHPKLY